MLGTIQVDLDGIWTYQRYLRRCIFKSGTEPVYQEGLLAFLELFRKYSLKATFFVVGKDARQPENVKLIRQLIAEGHEIANHTMTHPINFTALEYRQLEQEISLCGDILKEIGGKPIFGFRAPSFNVDERIFAMLSERNYLYDTSVLPSFANPLILKISHSILKRQFVNFKSGSFVSGFSPLTVYAPARQKLWKKSTVSIYEVPVSVLPVWRIPIHSSYVFIFGKKWFEHGLRRLSRKNIPIAYLFHGIDLVDLHKYNLRLPFFGDLKKRREICEYIVRKMASACELLPTNQLVERVKKG